MTSATASDWTGWRVREIRDSRGWTVPGLAARCAKTGAPQITTSVITNIETGRRGKDGTRRREVTVDEALALALALEVPPFLLFIPVDRGDALRVTGAVEMDSLQAAAWATGEREVPEHVDVLATLSAQEDPVRWAADWRRRSAPLQILRNAWLGMSLFNRMAETRKEGQTSRDALLAQMAVHGARWTDLLTTLGIAPPALPAKMAAIIRDQGMLEIAGPDDLAESED